MTEVPSPSRRPASVRRRLAAYILDSLVVGVIAFGVVAIVASLIPALTVSTPTDGTASIVVAPLRLVLQAAAATAVSGAYFAWSWSARAATPGQRVLGMTVLAEAGETRMPTRHAIVRWVALGAPFGVIAALVVELPVAWLLVATLAAVWTLVLLVTTWRDERRRGLHDRIAGTIVLR